ncbi:hypothetical protein B484DRAFT_452440, partial [Ochromonadaceae sp. CCMP2298]
MSGGYSRRMSRGQSRGFSSLRRWLRAGLGEWSSRGYKCSGKAGHRLRAGYWGGLRGRDGGLREGARCRLTGGLGRGLRQGARCGLTGGLGRGGGRGLRAGLTGGPRGRESIGGNSAGGVGGLSGGCGGAPSGIFRQLLCGMLCGIRRCRGSGLSSGLGIGLSGRHRHRRRYRRRPAKARGCGVGWEQEVAEVMQENGALTTPAEACGRRPPAVGQNGTSTHTPAESRAHAPAES